MVNTSPAISGHLSLLRVAFRHARPPRRSFSSVELRHRNSLSALSKLNVRSGSRPRRMRGGGARVSGGFGY